MGSDLVNKETTITCLLASCQEGVGFSYKLYHHSTNCVRMSITYWCELCHNESNILAWIVSE
jgi:hypothetical protein